MGYNPYSFFQSDVVVWNGLIILFGAASPFISEGDSLRKANELETVKHSSAPDQSPYIN